jgi:hypothetical protein
MTCGVWNASKGSGDFPRKSLILALKTRLGNLGTKTGLSNTVEIVEAWPDLPI